MSSCDCTQEAQDAKKWFMTALFLAVCLVFGLFNIDKMLSDPSGELKHAAEMKRLRVAATHLPTGVSDERQLALSARSNN
jgi:hypothetical protein